MDIGTVEVNHILILYITKKIYVRQTTRKRNLRKLLGVNIFLKLDFEKAFGRIEHGAMLEIMKKKGFGDKWISWMKLIFNSALP